MKIKYEIEMEDCFVFNDYLMKTSSLIHKTIRKGQLWWAIGPLAGGLGLSIVKGASPEQALMTLSILSVALSLPMFFIYPHYFRYCNKKQINKLQENNNEGFLGAHEMEMSDECLTEKFGNHENKIPWDSIIKIETTPAHTFIFIGDITAYIVPHKKIIDGNTSQFFDKLNDAFKRNNR